MRYFFFFTLLLVIAVISVAGFRGHKSPRTPIELFPDMDHQPKVKAQEPSAFFADGAAARLPVAGTISRDMPLANDYYSTGKIGDHWGAGIPIAMDMPAMERGRERYDINCAICHGAAAHGNGIVKQYGLSTIVTLQDERIRQMADGEIFHTITHGKNTMGAYGANIPIDDRWKIIAYLRALQRSQSTSFAELPPLLQQKLESIKPAASAPAQN